MDLVAGEPSSSLFSLVTTAAQIAPHVGEGVTIKLPSGVLGSTFPLSASTADGWVSFYFYGQPGGNTFQRDQPILEVRGGGKGLFRLKFLNEEIGIEYHNDTSWIASGTKKLVVDSVLFRFDFHFVIHDTTGTLTVYQDGAEITSTTFSAGDTLLRGESVADEI